MPLTKVVGNLLLRGQKVFLELGLSLFIEFILEDTLVENQNLASDVH